MTSGARSRWLGDFYWSPGGTARHGARYITIWHLNVGRRVPRRNALSTLSETERTRVMDHYVATATFPSFATMNDYLTFWFRTARLVWVEWPFERGSGKSRVELRRSLEFTFLAWSLREVQRSRMRFFLSSPTEGHVDERPPESTRPFLSYKGIAILLLPRCGNT